MQLNTQWSLRFILFPNEFRRASQVVLVVKNLPANAWDIRDEGSIPGRSPGGGHGNPLQYSCLENPMDRRAWWGYSPRGHKELGATENPFRNLCSVLTHDCYHRFELRNYSGVCLCGRKDRVSWSSYMILAPDVRQEMSHFSRFNEDRDEASWLLE